jgi:hypothetical protein
MAAHAPVAARRHGIEAPATAEWMITRGEGCDALASPAGGQAVVVGELSAMTTRIMVVRAAR